MISVTDGKKTVRENACYQYSLIFPQCFSNLFTVIQSQDYVVNS